MSRDPAAVPPSFDPAVEAEPTLVSQDEIDAVLADPTLGPAERMARLADLRQRILDDEYAHGDETHAPLQTQIMNALAMLAEGGHDYGSPPPVEADEGVGADESEIADDVESFDDDASLPVTGGTTSPRT